MKMEQLHVTKRTHEETEENHTYKAILKRGDFEVTLKSPNKLEEFKPGTELKLVIEPMNKELNDYTEEDD